MGPGRAMSQEAFEEVVRENMEDLGMDPEEALEDAIQSLTLQGVDLAGIVKCVPGVTTAKENSVISLLEKLRCGSDSAAKEETLNDLWKLCCGEEGSENVLLAVKNGGIEVLCKVCSGLRGEDERSLLSGLKTLRVLLSDIKSTVAFQRCEGPRIIINILNESSHNFNRLDSGFSIVAAAATGNEAIKELFMDLKVDEFILETMKGEFKGHIQSLYDAIRALLTPDDSRVLVSQVYGYARRFAKIGIANALVDAIKDSLNCTSLVCICIALKAVAVNDEICRSICENGGIDAILRCIDDSGKQRNKAAAKACCALLSKLAGSDTNKSAIIRKGGLANLITLSSRFSEDPAVLQEIMPIICSLSLRSPENAARAIEAGAGDMAIQAMQKFPAAYQMQKQCCLMIRNLVVRNAENRTLLLGLGIEQLIRKAKVSHESCKDAASAALRDLGFNDYNL